MTTDIYIWFVYLNWWMSLFFPQLKDCTRTWHWILKHVCWIILREWMKRTFFLLWQEPVFCRFEKKILFEFFSSSKWSFNCRRFKWSINCRYVTIFFLQKSLFSGWNVFFSTENPKFILGMVFFHCANGIKKYVNYSNKWNASHIISVIAANLLHKLSSIYL